MTDIRIMLRRDRLGLCALVRLRDADSCQFRTLRLPPATTIEETYELALAFALARCRGAALIQERLC